MENPTRPNEEEAQASGSVTKITLCQEQKSERLPGHRCFIVPLPNPADLGTLIAAPCSLRVLFFLIFIYLFVPF